MAGRPRDVVYEDRETVYTTGSGAPPAGIRRIRRDSDVETYERYEEDRGGFRRSEVRVRSRSRDRSEAGSRLPHFMREERVRDERGGTMVLRQVEQRRGRSPSPVVRFREERIVRARSESPPPLAPLPPPPVRDRVEVRERIVERRDPPPRGRSGSPHPNRFVSRERVVETRERGRSPSPAPRRERIRIVETERKRVPTPSPSPPPPPQVIRGPTIEREVITHYKDYHHGMTKVQPAPPRRPAVRDVEETEIDITRTRDRTEVDVRRRRSRSRERASAGTLVIASPPSPKPPVQRVYYTDDVIVEDKHRLRVDIDDRHHHRSTSVSAEHSHGGPLVRRRAVSVAPPPPPPMDDEAREITTRIDARGRMGEARGGVTRDWTIVDVPPGTERVRMDGAGGAGVDVDFTKYSGVRRSKFVPDRDAGKGALVIAGGSSSTATSTTTTTVSDYVDVRGRTRSRSRERINVQVKDKCGHEVEVEKTTVKKKSKKSKKVDDTWTEITKDLILREAIEELGYEYEETEWYYYIMQYLRYEEVLELVEISDDIRRERKRQAREIEWERRARRHHRHYDDDEIIVDHELVIERPPVRGYLR